MGKLLCEKKLLDVWCRNESVRAEIGQILHTHTHTHTRARARAAKLVVEIHLMNSTAASFDLITLEVAGKMPTTFVLITIAC